MAESPQSLRHQESLSPSHSNHADSPPPLETELNQLELNLPHSNIPPILSPHVEPAPLITRPVIVSSAVASVCVSSTSQSYAMPEPVPMRPQALHDLFFPPRDHVWRPSQLSPSRDLDSPIQFSAVPDTNLGHFPSHAYNHQSSAAVYHHHHNHHDHYQQPLRPQQGQSSNLSFASHYHHQRLPQSSQPGTRVVPVAPEEVIIESRGVTLHPDALVHPDALLAPIAAATSSVLQSTPGVMPEEGNFKQVVRSGLFCPNYFQGLSQEDPYEFVRQFELWANFNNLDEKSAISAFQLLLRGPAATWFKSLAKSSITKFQELSKLFIARYTILDKPWNEIGSLWTTRQLANQNVHDYVANIQFKADRLQVNAETVFQIALHGLLPGVKNCVLQKNVKSIEELLQTASLYELATDSTTDSNAQILQSLQDMKQQIDRLQIRPMSPMQNSTKRVHFSDSTQDYEQDFSSNDRGSSTVSPRDSPNSTYKNNYSTFNQRQNFQSESQGFQPNPRSNFNSQNSQKASYSNFTPNKFQNDCRANLNSGRPQNFYNKNSNTGNFQDSGQSCRNCGIAHKFNEKCPAYGLQCRFCKRLNHFSRCCLKAKSQSR